MSARRRRGRRVDPRPTVAFDRYSATPGRLRLHYSMNDETRFTCSYRIPGFDPSATPSWPTFAFHLGLARFPVVFAGLHPAVVLVRAGALKQPQVAQWREWYEAGLAEFHYRNHLPHEVVVRCEGSRPHPPSERSSVDRALVFHGGGKDSSVGGRFLRDLGIPHTWVLVGRSNTRRLMTRTSVRGPEAGRWMIRRKRSARARRLRIHRGHKPLNMELAFLGAFLAEIRSARFVVASNERSANEANLVVDGRAINHQYSKSFAFEASFDDYCREWLNPETRYFSLLRPLYEVQIARLFAGLPELHYGFVSCNRGVRRGRWCRRCAKCAFVYLALYPWLAPTRLRSIFGGDLLDRRRLVPLFRRLTGLEGHKPFDCVGTIEENAVAMHLAARRPFPPAVARHFIANAPEVVSRTPAEVDHIYEGFDSSNLLPPGWGAALARWAGERTAPPLQSAG